MLIYELPIYAYAWIYATTIDRAPNDENAGLNQTERQTSC